MSGTYAQSRAFLAMASEATTLAVGVITEIVGTHPGPASGITYEVDVMVDGGVLSVTAQQPWAGRMPDDVDVAALPVGTPVLFVGVGPEFARSYYWIAPVEAPAAPEEACPEEE